MNESFISWNTKTERAQSSILAMDASLVTVRPLDQVIGKTVPPGESQVMNDKNWGYVLRCEPQTHRQSFYFY